MDSYYPLLGYYDKQLTLITRLWEEIKVIDIGNYEQRYVFALKTQQLYTAIEDLFKQTAKAFENHIQNLAEFHKELLVRMNTIIPSIRPAVISRETFLLLNKLLAFRHFIRHAYDCELEEKELHLIQVRMREDQELLFKDLQAFREYILKLSKA